MQRFAILVLGSALVAAIGFVALSHSDEELPASEAPAVTEETPHGGFTPLAPDTADDSFDPGQVQLEPGDPSPEDYVWDEDGNLVLRPDYRP